MTTSSLMWDRAVLKVIKLREMLAVEKDRKRRLYLKRRLAGAIEWEKNTEWAYLEALRKEEGTNADGLLYPRPF